MRAALLLALGVVACAVAGPVPLKWGAESCRHCHMTLADPRFGAEIITRHGRALAYDDAGCAAEAIADGEVESGEVDRVFVIDFDRPDRLISADSATFVRSARFKTPMGSGVVAAGTPAAARELGNGPDDRVMPWADVVALARAGGLRPH